MREEVLERMRDSGDNAEQSGRGDLGGVDLPPKLAIKRFLITLSSGLALGFAIGWNLAYTPPMPIVPRPVLTLICGEESIEPKEADGRLDTEMSFVEYPTGETDEEDKPIIKSREDCSRFEFKLQSGPEQKVESDR